ncbi:ArsR family transcriptional regulator [Leifsonia aquatica]|uniref:ArsR family transcriptional regulator n=1 Tax=Leifsonia aquatica TaxID=144185 RepID=UPI003814B4E7
MPHSDGGAPGRRIPDDVRDAISAFSNVSRVDLINYLSKSGEVTVGKIIRDTAIPRPTLGRLLRELEELRVITGDIPIGDERRGKAVYYSLDRERTEALYAAWHAFALGRD